MIHFNRNYFKTVIQNLTKFQIFKLRGIVCQAACQLTECYSPNNTNKILNNFLTQNPEVCFCQQDKGKNLILMNITEYYNKLHQCFEDKDIFQELDHDPSKTDHSKLESLIKSVQKHFSTYTLKLLKPSEKLKCAMDYLKLINNQPKCDQSFHPPEA